MGHSANGELYTVNPATGESVTIVGISVPAVDGLLLEGGRLWAVQYELDQIAEIRLRPDLSSGVVEEITGNQFQTPTTMARSGRRLVAVNVKFDTGFPPTADQHEVVVVDRDCASWSIVTVRHDTGGRIERRSWVVAKVNP